MKKQIATWTAVSFALLLSNSALWAEEQGKTVPEWISIIQKEDEALRQNDDPSLNAIRLGAGLCIGNYSGLLSQKPRKEFLAAIDVFKLFMKEQGESLIEKWRSGQKLSTDEMKYWYILNGVYFNRDAHQRSKGKGRRYFLPLTEEEEKACAQYRKQVVEFGVGVLYSAYRGE